MTVGERIRDKRIELGLTQEEVANKLGYKSRSSVNKIETSRSLPISKVERMATVLGCTPAYLMGWEDTYSTESAFLLGQAAKDPEAKRMLSYFLSLSDKGREKALDNLEDLVKIYGKNS